MYGKLQIWSLEWCPFGARLYLGHCLFTKTILYIRSSCSDHASLADWDAQGGLFPFEQCETRHASWSWIITALHFTYKGQPLMTLIMSVEMFWIWSKFKVCKNDCAKGLQGCQLAGMLACMKHSLPSRSNSMTLPECFLSLCHHDRSPAHDSERQLATADTQSIAACTTDNHRMDRSDV